jgi:dihydrodipicolinate synthase/N-acetylneuraminate lyase
MTTPITGIIPPLITCFDKNGKFDEKAQREVIRFLLPNVQAFFPLGTYGSGPLMSVDERKQVAEVIIDEVNGKVPVIIHVGAITTDQAVDLAKHAEKAGATAVAAISPFYYKYPEEDLLNYFRALIKAVKLPVFAYNNPNTANNTLTPKMIATLASEGLAGIKDSAFDLLTFYSFLECVPGDRFTHIVGTEAIAAAGVEAGAKGVISGLANVWPELMQELWTALMCNDGRKAGGLQLKVNRARAVLKYGPTVVVCYEGLKMRGVNAGYAHPPFGPLSSETVEKIRKAFVELGMLQ